MVLESTMVCVDNSDYMRNGDFVPTRLQAQQDAVNLICHSKTRSNPENNVGLLCLANTEVLSTLTTDAGKILAKLHQVTPKGNLHFLPGIRIAHLVLKHRQGKNHKMRIVAFIGSPIGDEEKELTKLAKRLKKEKVNVDVINFGEENANTDLLTNFVNTINGKDGNSSHLVTVPVGPMLSDALVSSPIVVGEDGTGAVPAGMSGFEFGVDPNEDPELALALRVSMEEQRARQEDEARKVTADSAVEAGVPAVAEDNSEEALLKRALEMSMVEMESDDAPTTTPATPAVAAAPATPASTAVIPTPAAPVKAPQSSRMDFAAMSEEEQIAYAMQMSMQQTGKPRAVAGEEAAPMDTDDTAKDEDDKEEMEAEEEADEDYSEVINDPAFLQSVLEGLPGVDPQSEAIRNAMGQLTQKDSSGQKKDEKKDDKK